MDLVKIGFQINANGLKDANNEVDKLLGKVDNIGTKGKKASSEFESSQKKVKDSTQQVSNEVDKTSKALEKQKIIGDYLGKGLDKTTATSIASFKQLGATVSQTNEYISNQLNNKGLEQTRKELTQLGKEQQKQQEQQAKLVQDTVTQYEKLSNKSLGGGILDSIEQQNKGLEELKKQYKDQEKEQQKALDDIETARQKHFSKVQKDYEKQQQAIVDTQQQAIDKQVKAQNTLNESNQKAITLEQAKAKYVSQGYGKTDSTRLARLEVSGADVTTLNNYKSAIEATTRATQALNPAVEKVTTSHSNFLGQVKGIAIYAALSAAIYGVMTTMTSLAVSTVKIADEYTSTQQRLKLYIKDAQTLGEVNTFLAKSAIQNNVGLRENAALYAKLAPAMQRIGANTAATNQVVDAFGKSLRIGGATAMEAASATIQFAQAMASGKLAGDEFRSISEASPRFLKAIADGSGIAAEKLKAMSSAGALTTEVIARALVKEYHNLSKESESLGYTLEQGTNALKTGFMSLVGEFNEGVGITKYLGSLMADMGVNMIDGAKAAKENGEAFRVWAISNADNISNLVEAFKLLSTVIISRYVAALVIARYESMKTALGLISIQVAAASAGRSITFLSGAISLANIAMKGLFGSLGGLILTVAGVVASYVLFNKESEKTTKSLQEEGETIEDVVAKYKELTKIQQEKALLDARNQVQATTETYIDQKDALAGLVSRMRWFNEMTGQQSDVLDKLVTWYKTGKITLEQFNGAVLSQASLTQKSKDEVTVYGNKVKDAETAAKNATDKVIALTNATKGSGDAAAIAGDQFSKFLTDAKTQTDINKLALRYISAFNLDQAKAVDLAKQDLELRAQGKYATLEHVKAQQELLKSEQDMAAVTSARTKAEKKLNKEKKDDDKDLKRLEDVRKNYQDQIDIVERLNMFKANGVSYDVAKIAAEKDYYDAYTDTAKALEVAETKKALARFDMLGDLENETLLLTKVLALQEQSVSYDVARSLAQAGFAANSEGLLAASQSMHNTLVAQQYSLADQVKQQTLLNHYLAQGLSIEEATVKASFKRLEIIQKEAGMKGLSDQQKKLKEDTLENQKQLKIKQTEAQVSQSLTNAEKQRVAYVNAQAGGYANLIKNMAIANKIASDPTLSPSQAKALVEAEELTNYEKELAELKRQTYIATLNESEAVKTLVGNYSTMDSVQIGVLANQQRLLEIAKELAEEAEKQKNPLGDFSNVDFSAFGDFGNPFQSALDGMNELIRTTMSGGEQIKKLNEEIDAAKLKGLDTTQQEFDLNLEMQKQTKDKKQATNKAVSSALSLTKSLFKEESKGYKVVSGLEKAYQASKIAFALWEKKDTIKTMAIKLAGYAKDMALFIGGIATKITAQMGLNIVQAQGAVASAAQAPPPVGFASAAAMIALMAGLGIAISSGGSSGGEYVDTSNQGTGTVFGDSEAQSASIANSIDLLSENSDLMLPLTSAMLRSLKNIESSIGGVTNLILRGGLGGDFSNLEFDGMLTGIIGKANNLFVKVTNGLESIGLTSFGLGTSIVSSVVGGLFGKTSQKVVASGIYGGSQTLGSILENGMSLSQYADVKTTKKSWFGSSSKVKTKYSSIDDEIEQQFTLIFKGFYDSILSATDILGADLSAVQTNLENAVVSIGKINLKGLSGEQIQEKLEAVFGAAADSLAKQAFGGLEDFQTVGEGYYETLVKVASAVEEAAYYTDRLNVTAINYTDIINKQADDLATEIIRQSYLTKVGISTIKGGMTDLVNTFDGSAEEITDFINTLEDLQEQLFMTGKSGDYLTSSMILGAGGLDSLASGLDAYFEMLSPAEQAAELTRRLTNEFAILGKALPADVKAFRNLVSSIDITTEAGQKLYGQIIALAPEFNDLQDALDSANSDVNALVQSLRDLAEQARAARGETEQPRNLAYTRSQFEQASVLAMQGDIASAEKLLTLGKDLMGLSKTYSVTGSEYARDLALIQRAATVSADIQEQGLGTSISTTLTPSTGAGTTTPTIPTTNSTMTAELQGMRGELNAGLFAIAKFVQNVDSRTERWDDGNRVMVGIQPENGDIPVPVKVVP